MEPRKYEKIIVVVFAVMLAFLCVTVIKIYGVIIANQLNKPKPEIVYSVDTKYCKIIVDGSCIPMRADTNINISEVAGYDKIYNVSINYNTADIPQEKPTELKVEKTEPKKVEAVKK